MNILWRAFIVSAIFVQICLAKPTPENANVQDVCHQKSISSDIEPTESDSASNQLLKFTLKAFQELALEYVTNSKNISDHLLKNSKIANSQSAKIMQFKRNLTEFEEKFASCEGLEDLFILVELYSNTTSDYYELAADSLDDDDKLILKLLRKYGSEDLDNDLMDMLSRLVDKFQKKFDDLKDDLNKEEGNTGKNIIKWVTNLKNANNFDDKVAAFEQFFILYEEE